MMQFRLKRWWVALAAVFLLFSLLLAGGFFWATRILKTKVETALGANGEVAEIKVGFSSIEILDLRIKAASGWPAADELRAKRVLIRPDLAALFSSQLRISSIEVDEAYVSVLRRKDGKVLILPSLLNKPADQKKGDKPEAEQSTTSDLAVQLGGVKLTGGALEFFDATVRQNPHKLRLEQVNARLGKINIPALTGSTDIDVQGIVKGVQRDGKLSIKGHAEFSSRDSEIAFKLQGVDVLAFQPYLIKAAETGVRRGSLDLDLRSTVHNNRLKAPGTLTLSGLELSPGGSFMGVPRSAVVSMLKDKNGKIILKFTLDGNINDPSFSLNENLSARLGASLAGVLGISVEGLARGLGTTGGAAVKGLGDTMGKIFGRK